MTILFFSPRIWTISLPQIYLASILLTVLKVSTNCFLNNLTFSPPLTKSHPKSTSPKKKTLTLKLWKSAEGSVFSEVNDVNVTVPFCKPAFLCLFQYIKATLIFSNCCSNRYFQLAAVAQEVPVRRLVVPFPPVWSIIWYTNVSVNFRL